MLRMESLDFLNTDARSAAQLLLGCVFERLLDGHVMQVRIVETEAYDQSDAASHSYRGVTPRTAVMFGEYGQLYVYFTYGMHYCCNVVVGPVGYGSAVLIRAVEPVAGEAYMQKLRPGHKNYDLSNGPAKLCQALAIDKKLNGHNLTKAPLRLIAKAPLAESDITATPRIGISRAQDLPLRFFIASSPYVSKA